MVTQNFYMPAKAAKMLGLTEDQVVDLIQAGKLKAQYRENTASYVIDHNDIVAYLKGVKDFKTIQKTLQHRILLVDRDAQKRDLIRIELEHYPNIQVKVATSERDVRLISSEFLPDIIFVHLAATLRQEDRVGESLREAKRRNRAYVVFYHDYAPEAVNRMPQVQHQVLTSGADEVVSTHSGVRPLVDLVVRHFGLGK